MPVLDVKPVLTIAEQANGAVAASRTQTEIFLQIRTLAAPEANIESIESKSRLEMAIPWKYRSWETSLVVRYESFAAGMDPELDGRQSLQLALQWQLPLIAALNAALGRVGVAGDGARVHGRL